MDLESLTKQLEKAKKEGKVENKKSKFLKKKTKGEKGAPKPSDFKRAKKTARKK